jgi:membrane-associated protease RseP (regulator of RpoE activity)
VRAHQGKPIAVVIRRAGRDRTLHATPRLDQGVVRIGVVSTLESKRVSIAEAVPQTFVAGREIVSGTVDALGKTFSASGLGRYGKTLTNTKGGFSDQERPRTLVGIVADGGSITGGEWWILLLLLANINLVLALINGLPIPPLDGGHAVVALYEGVASRVRGREVRVDFQKLLPVAAAAVVIIVMFGLSALYLDLRSL